MLRHPVFVYKINKWGIFGRIGVKVKYSICTKIKKFLHNRLQELQVFYSIWFCKKYEELLVKIQEGIQKEVAEI